MTYTLRFDDIHRVLTFLPKDVLKLMRIEPLFLAGGFIRARIANETVSDIDLLADTKDKCGAVAANLAAQRAVSLYRTRNAYTIIAPNRVPVQIIHRWLFSDPQALLESFDFTIARAVVWFDRTNLVWKSAVDKDFYEDLAARRLRYCFPDRNEDAGGSLLRVQKFLKKGYDISPEELGKVLARLVDKVKPDTGLWRMDERGKAKVFGGLLREVDPLTIIDGLRPSDESMEEGQVPDDEKIGAIDGVI